MLGLKLIHVSKRDPWYIFPLLFYMPYHVLWDFVKMESDCTNQISKSKKTQSSVTILANMGKWDKNTEGSVQDSGMHIVDTLRENAFLGRGC